MKLAVCMKWVDTRPEIDHLTGEVTDDRRWFAASRADQSALETALKIRERSSDGSEVMVICAGPPAVEALLRQALASGADRAVRVDVDPTIDAAAVAAAVVPVLSDSDLVLCGDWSLDRGTGSFPAFLAHGLDAAQALGCTRVALVDGVVRLNDNGQPGDVDQLGFTDGRIQNDQVIEAERRLDGGRREHLILTGRAVVSVEAGAELRRAGLRALLAVAAAEIAVEGAPPAVSLTHHLTSTAPFRPRSREIEGPTDDDPRIRLLEVAGAKFEPRMSQARHLEPAAAADYMLEQLAGWGVAPAPGPAPAADPAVGPPE